ncbi:MAG: DNA recombination protein RmuC, partial [Desulfocucumaceae bacterium]
MDVLVAVLLVAVVVLVALVLIRQRGMVNQGQLDLAIINNLNQFRREIQESVETSRREMSDARVDLSKRAGETLKLMADMHATVEKIISRQEEANKLGQSLKDILSTPKLRGNYGEIVLEEMLERILPRGMWERQYRV